MSSHSPIKKLFAACVIAIVAATSFDSLAQSRKAERRIKIISGDFLQNRPAGQQNSQTAPVKPPEQKSHGKAGAKSGQTASNRPKSSKQKQIAKAKQIDSYDTYRLASARPETPASKGRAPKPRRTVAAQLGLTMWRLRPLTEKDKGAIISVKEDEKESKWVAERVEADTVFSKGDFVRLSIESPRAGYLYVFNQEQYANGKIGDATMIYPWHGMARGENHVRPGWIVDIPDQDDDPSYYRANPSQANQLGELLTILVTTKPLDLPNSEEPLRFTKTQFAEWQKTWKSESDRYEMEGGAGRLWTEAEQQAGSRLRKRELTRKDPAPQTIYHVAATNVTGYFINVRLSYAR